MPIIRELPWEGTESNASSNDAEVDSQAQEEILRRLDELEARRRAQMNEMARTERELDDLRSRREDLELIQSRLASMKEYNFRDLDRLQRKVESLRQGRPVSVTETSESSYAPSSSSTTSSAAQKSAANQYALTKQQYRAIAAAAGLDISFDSTTTSASSSAAPTSTTTTTTKTSTSQSSSSGARVRRGRSESVSSQTQSEASTTDLREMYNMYVNELVSRQMREEQDSRTKKHQKKARRGQRHSHRHRRVLPQEETDESVDSSLFDGLELREDLDSAPQAQRAALAEMHERQLAAAAQASYDRLVQQAASQRQQQQQARLSPTKKPQQSQAQQVQNTKSPRTAPPPQQPRQAWAESSETASDVPSSSARSEQLSRLVDLYSQYWSELPKRHPVFSSETNTEESSSQQSAEEDDRHDFTGDSSSDGQALDIEYPRQIFRAGTVPMSESDATSTSSYSLDSSQYLEIMAARKAELLARQQQQLTRESFSTQSSEQESSSSNPVSPSKMAQLQMERELMELDKVRQQRAQERRQERERSMSAMSSSTTSSRPESSSRGSSARVSGNDALMSEIRKLEELYGEFLQELKQQEIFDFAPSETESSASQPIQNRWAIGHPTTVSDIEEEEEEESESSSSVTASEESTTSSVSLALAEAKARLREQQLILEYETEQRERERERMAAYRAQVANRTPSSMTSSTPEPSAMQRPKSRIGYVPTDRNTATAALDLSRDSVDYSESEGETTQTEETEETATTTTEGHDEDEYAGVGLRPTTAASASKPKSPAAAVVPPLPIPDPRFLERPQTAPSSDQLQTVISSSRHSGNLEGPIWTTTHHAIHGEDGEENDHHQGSFHSLEPVEASSVFTEETDEHEDHQSLNSSDLSHFFSPQGEKRRRAFLERVDRDLERYNDLLHMTASATASEASSEHDGESEELERSKKVHEALLEDGTEDSAFDVDSQTGTAPRLYTLTESAAKRPQSAHPSRRPRLTPQQQEEFIRAMHDDETSSIQSASVADSTASVTLAELESRIQEQEAQMHINESRRDELQRMVAEEKQRQLQVMAKEEVEREERIISEPETPKSRDVAERRRSLQFQRLKQLHELQQQLSRLASQQQEEKQRQQDFKRELLQRHAQRLQARQSAQSLDSSQISEEEDQSQSDYEEEEDVIATTVRSAPQPTVKPAASASAGTSIINNKLSPLHNEANDAAVSVSCASEVDSDQGEEEEQDEVHIRHQGDESEDEEEDEGTEESEVRWMERLLVEKQAELEAKQKELMTLELERKLQEQEKLRQAQMMQLREQEMRIEQLKKIERQALLALEQAHLEQQRDELEAELREEQERKRQLEKERDVMIQRERLLMASSPSTATATSSVSGSSDVVYDRSKLRSPTLVHQRAVSNAGVSEDIESISSSIVERELEALAEELIAQHARLSQAGAQQQHQRHDDDEESEEQSSQLTSEVEGSEGEEDQDDLESAIRRLKAQRIQSMQLAELQEERARLRRELQEERERLAEARQQYEQDLQARLRRCQDEGSQSQTTEEQETSASVPPTASSEHESESTTTTAEVEKLQRQMRLATQRYEQDLRARLMAAEAAAAVRGDDSHSETTEQTEEEEDEESDVDEESETTESENASPQFLRGAMAQALRNVIDSILSEGDDHNAASAAAAAIGDSESQTEEEDEEEDEERAEELRQDRQLELERLREIEREKRAELARLETALLEEEKAFEQAVQYSFSPKRQQQCAQSETTEEEEDEEEEDQNSSIQQSEETIHRDDVSETSFQREQGMVQDALEDALDGQFESLHELLIDERLSRVQQQQDQEESESLGSSAYEEGEEGTSEGGDTESETTEATTATEDNQYEDDATSESSSIQPASSAGDLLRDFQELMHMNGSNLSEIAAVVSRIATAVGDGSRREDVVRLLIGGTESVASSRPTATSSRSSSSAMDSMRQPQLQQQRPSDQQSQSSLSEDLRQTRHADYEGSSAAESSEFSFSRLLDVSEKQAIMMSPSRQRAQQSSSSLPPIIQVSRSSGPSETVSSSAASTSTRSSRSSRSGKKSHKKISPQNMESSRPTPLVEIDFSQDSDPSVASAREQLARIGTPSRTLAENYFIKNLLLSPNKSPSMKKAGVLPTVTHASQQQSQQQQTDASISSAPTEPLLRKLEQVDSKINEKKNLPFDCSMSVTSGSSRSTSFVGTETSEASQSVDRGDSEAASPVDMRKMSELQKVDALLQEGLSRIHLTPNQIQHILGSQRIEFDDSLSVEDSASESQASSALSESLRRRRRKISRRQRVFSSASERSESRASTVSTTSTLQMEASLLADRQSEDESSPEDQEKDRRMAMQVVAREFTEEIVSNEIIIQNVNLQILGMVNDRRHETDPTGTANTAGLSVRFTKKDLTAISNRFIYLLYLRATKTAAAVAEVSASEKEVGEKAKLQQVLFKTIQEMIAKYEGADIAASKDLLLRDISDLLFDEMVFQRVMEQIDQSYQEEITDLEEARHALEQNMHELHKSRESDFRSLLSQRISRISSAASPTSASAKAAATAVAATQAAIRNLQMARSPQSGSASSGSQPKQADDFQADNESVTSEVEDSPQDTSQIDAFERRHPHVVTATEHREEEEEEKSEEEKFRDSRILTGLSSLDTTEDHEGYGEESDPDQHYAAAYYRLRAGDVGDESAGEEEGAPHHHHHHHRHYPTYQAAPESLVVRTPVTGFFSTGDRDQSGANRRLSSSLSADAFERLVDTKSVSSTAGGGNGAAMSTASSASAAEESGSVSGVGLLVSSGAKSPAKRHQGGKGGETDGEDIEIFSEYVQKTVTSRQSPEVTQQATRRRHQQAVRRSSVEHEDYESSTTATSTDMSSSDYGFDDFSVASSESGVAPVFPAEIMLAIPPGQSTAQFRGTMYGSDDDSGEHTEEDDEIAPEDAVNTESPRDHEPKESEEITVEDLADFKSQ